MVTTPINSTIVHLLDRSLKWMGTRRVYGPSTIPYVIPVRDRPIGRIWHWKEDFENDKEGNQTHSDDGDNRPFDSRHHAPPSSHHAGMPTFLLHSPRPISEASRCNTLIHPTISPIWLSLRREAFRSVPLIISPEHRLLADRKEPTMRTLWPEWCIWSHSWG